MSEEIHDSTIPHEDIVTSTEADPWRLRGNEPRFDSVWGEVLYNHIKRQATRTRPWNQKVKLSHLQVIDLPDSDYKAVRFFGTGTVFLFAEHLAEFLITNEWSFHISHTNTQEVQMVAKYQGPEVDTYEPEPLMRTIAGFSHHQLAKRWCRERSIEKVVNIAYDKEEEPGRRWRVYVPMHADDRLRDQLDIAQREGYDRIYKEIDMVERDARILRKAGDHEGSDLAFYSIREMQEFWG